MELLITKATSLGYYVLPCEFVFFHSAWWEQSLCACPALLSNAFVFIPKLGWFLHINEPVTTGLNTWGGFCRCLRSLSVKLSCLQALAVLIYSGSQSSPSTQHMYQDLPQVPHLVLWMETQGDKWGKHRAYLISIVSQALLSFIG